LKARVQNTGFTLLEIVVAVSIIAIVFISIFRLHTETLSLSSLSRFYALAPILAQSKLSESAQDIEKGYGSESGGFGEAFPGYEWRIAVEDVESELLGSVAEDLKRVEVTITARDVKNVYQLQTYRFFPLGD
jgi:general secretion pathway protein I